MLAKNSNMTQAQLAQALGCDQTTVSNDIIFLKQASKQFMYNLAKGDLAFYYKQCINGIEEAIFEAWKIYSQHDSNDFFNSTKLKLMALKIVITANESKFKLMSDGSSVLALQAIQERIDKLENQQFSQSIRQQIPLSR